MKNPLDKGPLLKCPKCQAWRLRSNKTGKLANYCSYCAHKFKLEQRRVLGCYSSVKCFNGILAEASKKIEKGDEG